MLILPSCGTSHETRYVYVNAPQRQSPQPEQQPTAQPSYATVTNEPPQSYASTPSRDCAALSEESIRGYFRGFGHGRSTSLTAARNMAIRRAQADILRQVKSVRDQQADDELTSTDAIASERSKENDKARLRGVLKNTRTICSNNTKEGGIIEYTVCLEVSAQDVSVLVAPIIEELNAESKSNIQKKLNQGQ